MALTESPNAQAWREFGGIECAGPGCVNTKERSQSFCKACYFRLPADMRKALYRRFGSGYEEAYFEAKQWLQENPK